MTNGIVSRRNVRTLIVAVLVTLGPATPPVLAQGLTTAQGEAILNELKEVRRQVEQLRKEFAEAVGPRRAGAPEGPAKVAIADGRTIGSASSPLVLIEFTDYQCPYCRVFAVNVFPALKTKYIDTGQLQFVSRDFPLDSHPQAELAARAARCAAEQGKYWELRPVLFANSAALQQDKLLTYARDLSLDTAGFQQCLEKEAHVSSIRRDLDDALAAGIQGTPTFVLGRRTSTGVIEGIRIVGAQPVAAFDAKIAELLAAK